MITYLISLGIYTALLSTALLNLGSLLRIADRLGAFVGSFLKHEVAPRRRGISK